MMKTPHKSIIFLFTLFTALGILVLSLTPDPPGQTMPFPWFDKLAHGAAYSVLGGLASLSCFLIFRQRIPGMIIAVTVTLAYGGVIELIQPIFARSGDWLDMLADFIGASVGILFVFLLTLRAKGEGEGRL